jgi:hypothetical protein
MPDDKSSKSPPPSKQADGDDTRSGRPNPQQQPDHPREHKSGYGGDGGEPKSGSK